GAATALRQYSPDQPRPVLRAALIPFPRPPFAPSVDCRGPFRHYNHSRPGPVAVNQRGGFLMAAPNLSEPRVLSLSRRQFLSRLAAASTLTPALFVAGCQRTAVPQRGTEGAADGLVLRASRFQAAPDGRSREVMGYNQTLPGPVLRVKE